MTKKLVRLKIKDINRKEELVYSDLDYDIVGDSCFKLDMNLIQMTNVFKVFRDYEDDGQVYLAYPEQPLKDLRVKEGCDKHIIDIAYLKKIAKDNVKYTIEKYVEN